MKKFVFLTIFLLAGLISWAQSPEIYVVANSSTAFTKILPIGTHIQVASIPGIEYVTRIAVGKPRTVAWLLGDASRYYKIQMAYNSGKILVGDTAGIGSTANLGTIVYKTSDYNFYGCTATPTVSWTKLNN